MYNPIIKIYANNNTIKQCKNIFSKKIHSTKTSKTKKIHNTENQKDEQHGSHGNIGMDPGAGKMLKWTGGAQVPV